MTPVPQCEVCCASPAHLLRPRDGSRVCRTCFYALFEDEVLETVRADGALRRGDRVAIGASGGKDSTVLIHVLDTLNRRHDLGLDLVLLSIDEGIRGYRDDSLETVHRNRDTYTLPLTVLSYRELYGWTMDEIVASIGPKSNCTFCGVFRRQALDRGAVRLGCSRIATGHNADDAAETVLMNLLRGDAARLARGTTGCGAAPGNGNAGDEEPVLGGLPRTKPLRMCYEKEIVLYARFKGLDYFSTECT
jgi:cytoplasmic tRNA 2-thiolation protein 1